MYLFDKIQTRGLIGAVQCFGHEIMKSYFHKEKGQTAQNYQEYCRWVSQSQKKTILLWLKGHNSYEAGVVCSYRPNRYSECGKLTKLEQGVRRWSVKT